MPDAPQLDKTDVQTILNLMDVARVAVSPGVGSWEGGRLLHSLLSIVQEVMPPDLRAQDPRVQAAEVLWARLWPRLSSTNLGEPT